MVTPGNDLDAGVLVERALESGAPFDVLLMDVNFSISGRRIEKVLADIRQVYEANSVATCPSVVVHSRIRKGPGLGDHLATTLAANSGFDIVTFIIKPARLDEKRAAILRCVTRNSAVAATKLSNSEALAQNEATLGDVLTAFEKMRARNFAQFRSAAAQLHRACLALPPEEMLRPYRHRVDTAGTTASAAFADAVGIVRGVWRSRRKGCPAASPTLPTTDHLCYGRGRRGGY